jgi:DNA-binding response OmpR family regulator
MKLLIAEDDVFFQNLLQRVLASEYEIVIAHDGNEAWATLQSPDAPRLAILDWVMPGLSGPQVCRRVRACAALSSTYLIILTAKNNEADIVSGLRAGADDYITKPPIPAELRARVKVGERVLALQAEVEAQSLRANGRSGKEYFVRESLVHVPAPPLLLHQETIPGIGTCARQDSDRSDAIYAGETTRLTRRLLSDLQENRHPHR